MAPKKDDKKNSKRESKRGSQIEGKWKIKLLCKRLYLYIGNQLWFPFKPKMLLYYITH